MNDAYAYNELNMSGQAILYETLLIPVRKSRKTKGLMAVHRRISSREDVLDKMADQRLNKNSNSLSSSFLSNVSHELRTPLNWIIGFSDLIRSENDMIKIREYNEAINRGSTLLLSLIEMLIDMSMILKKELKVSFSRVNLHELFSGIQMVTTEELSVLGKKIDVRFNLKDRDRDFSIVTDRHKLQQVLLNLVHNSMKFTEEGFIEIGGMLNEEEQFLFYVRDSGIGISPTKQRYIFDLFRKGDESTTYKIQWPGIGAEHLQGLCQAPGRANLDRFSGGQGLNLLLHRQKPGEKSADRK